jgi:hypothetical protein
MAALPKIFFENRREAATVPAAVPMPANSGAYQGELVIYLIPAGRTRATEAFSPLRLAPPDALIVAVGRHEFLDIAAVAWISDGNEIKVGIEADRTATGRSVLFRVYTRDSNIVRQAAVFEARGARAIAAAVFADWDGLPVAGMAILSRRRSITGPGTEKSLTEGRRISAACLTTECAVTSGAFTPAGASISAGSFSNDWRNGPDGFFE